MTITIIRTNEYSRFVSHIPPGVEMDKAEEEIAKNPLGWPVIQGTGGIRKARFSIGNKGKRGGGRIWYFYLVQKESIYLLKAYTKNIQEDLTIEERARWKQFVK
jgi:hypothetical protein